MTGYKPGDKVVLKKLLFFTVTFRPTFENLPVKFPAVRDWKHENNSLATSSAFMNTWRYNPAA